MSNESNTQALLPFSAVVTEAVSKVFGAKPVKNAKGFEVGTVIAMNGRKAVAEALGLKGKENKDALDEKLLAASDEAFRKVKSEIAGLNGDWTLHRLANRTVGSGIRQVTLTIREVSRKAQIADEKVAKAWFPDLPLDEAVAKVREMRESQQKQLADAKARDEAANKAAGMADAGDAQE